MTKKLEKLFDLPSFTEDLVASTTTEADEPKLTIEETKTALVDINLSIDKIQEALPLVRDLETGDTELDAIADKAIKSFEDLSELGMQVDSRYASEILAVAGTMLGHALTAKTNKLNKKLKMVELQLKKARLDLDVSNASDVMSPFQQGQGQVLNRNELLEKLTGDRNYKDK
jgi:hypothetical protein